MEDEANRLEERVNQLRQRASRQRVLRGEWSPDLSTRPRGMPQPGSVLHIVGKSLPHSQAGHTVRTHHIARAQIAAGLRPVVVTRLGFPWDVGAELSESTETIDGVSYQRLGGPDQPAPLDDLLTQNLNALVELVEVVRPSVLHAHSDFHNALLANALGRKFDLPVIYEVRGFWEETWLSKSPERDTTAEEYVLRRQRELEGMLGADHVVTLTEVMRSRMIGDGVPAEKVTIVPNAVDPELFPYTTARNSALTRQLGIPDDEPVIGYISSLVAYEGVETLIQATARLRRIGIPVHCLVVGDGAERQRLEQISRRGRVRGYVHFTGQVPHDMVNSYYRAIDVFVIPRRNERVTRLVQPLKPFEALSTGLPLVVSDVPALREIVERSGAGMTFIPGDAADLVRVLVGLLGDPLLRADFGARGARYVRDNNTWVRNAERYGDVYTKLGAMG